MMIQPVQCVFPNAATEPLAFGAAIGDTEQTSAGTTIALTVPAGGVPEGKRVVLLLAMDYAAGAVSATDDGGNVYSVDEEYTDGANPNRARLVALSAPVTTELLENDVITVTHPSVSVRALCGVYLQGVNESAPVDVSASDAFDWAGGVAPLECPAVTTTVPTLILGFFASRDAAKTWTSDTGAGWSTGRGHTPSSGSAIGALINYKGFAATTSGTPSRARAFASGTSKFSYLTVAYKA